MGDIEDDVLHLIKARATNMSNENRIIHFHAHPRTWGSGFNAQALETSVDGVLVLPGQTAQLHNLEMTSSLDFVVRFH